MENAQQFAWKTMREFDAIPTKESELFRFGPFDHGKRVDVDDVIKEVKESLTWRDEIDKVTRLMDVGADRIDNKPILESD